MLQIWSSGRVVPMSRCADVQTCRRADVQTCRCLRCLSACFVFGRSAETFQGWNDHLDQWAKSAWESHMSHPPVSSHLWCPDRENDRNPLFFFLFQPADGERWGSRSICAVRLYAALPPAGRTVSHIYEHFPAFVSLLWSFGLSQHVWAARIVLLPIYF